MCRSSDKVGPFICTTISPHGTTVLNRYGATFNCLCLFLSHWHNPVWCIFQRDRMLTLRVGHVQALNFTSEPRFHAEIPWLSYQSPFLKLVRCIDYFATNWNFSTDVAHLETSQENWSPQNINTAQIWTCTVHNHYTHFKYHILYSQPIRAALSVIGCTFCQSPSVSLAERPKLCFSLFVVVFFLWKVPHSLWTKKSPLTLSCLSHLQVIEFDDGSGSVLRIQPLRTPRDEAIYECVASNSVGETSATTRLTVLRGRSFTNPTRA